MNTLETRDRSPRLGERWPRLDWPVLAMHLAAGPILGTVAPTLALKQMAIRQFSLPTPPLREQLWTVGDVWLQGLAPALVAGLVLALPSMRDRKKRIRLAVSIGLYAALSLLVQMSLISLGPARIVFADPVVLVSSMATVALLGGLTGLVCGALGLIVARRPAARREETAGG